MLKKCLHLRYIVNFDGYPNEDNGKEKERGHAI